MKSKIFIFTILVLILTFGFIYVNYNYLSSNDNNGKKECSTIPAVKCKTQKIKKLKPAGMNTYPTNLLPIKHAVMK